jgi:uncharacterized protein (DUF3820 family)
MNEEFDFNPAKLVSLAHAKMPFGKYKGYYLAELPENYIVWFKHKGYPKGDLGRMLMEIYEIKLNGLEHLLRKIRQQYPENKDHSNL